MKITQVIGDVPEPVMDGDTLIVPMGQPLVFYPDHRSRKPPSDVSVVIWIRLTSESITESWHFYSGIGWVEWNALDEGQQYEALHWYLGELCRTPADRERMVHDRVPWEKNDPLIDMVRAMIALEQL